MDSSGLCRGMNSSKLPGPPRRGYHPYHFSTGCTVVELFGAKTKPPYEKLASALELEYQALYCTPDSADIRVIVDERESVVTELTSNQD